MQLAGLETALRQSQQRLAARRIGIEEQQAPFDAFYKLALGRQAEMVPLLRLLELTSPDRAPAMQFRVAADDENLYGIAFDPATGEAKVVLKQPIQKADKPSRNVIRSSQNKMISELLSATFYPVLESYLRNKYKDERAVAERLAVLRDQFGNINAARMFGMLPKEAKKLWTTLYRMYERRLREGMEIGDVFAATSVPVDINTQEDLLSLPVGGIGQRDGKYVFRVSSTGNIGKDFVVLSFDKERK